MKMRRILSTLLCVMMVICSIPMMASATATAADLSAMATAIGVSGLAPVDEFYFDGDYQVTDDITVKGELAFSDENGLTLAGNTSWKYTPSTGYTPLSEDAWAVGVQIPIGGKSAIQATNPNGNGRAYVELTDKSIAVYTGDGSTTAVAEENTYFSYVPGTSYAEYLLTLNDAGGYSVYIKSETETEGEWKLYAATEGWRSGASTGLSISGVDGTNGCQVKYTATYQVAAADYNSIDAILGGPTGSTYSFDFDENSSFANTSGRDGFKSTSGYTTDADGLTLVSATDTSSAFVFGPFSSYSPLNSQTIWSTTTYFPQALYLKAKGNFNLRTPGPNGYGRVYMNVTTDSGLFLKTGSVIESNSVIIEDEWTEYLFVPNGRTVNTDVTADGYSLYVKAEKSTGGKWVKAMNGGFDGAGSGYGSTRITFSGVTGHIKSVRTMAISGSASYADATPDGATCLYLDEDFDAEPVWGNKSATHVVYENGNAVFPSTSTTGKIKFDANDVVIPVGGYAEFRTQYSGVEEITLYDGAKYIYILQQSDYGSLPGITKNTASAGYTGNNNSSWRTWRVVRSEAGYTVYSKADGDTGWYIHGTGTGTSSTESPKIRFVYSGRNDGDTGDSKIDYLRVCGPAPTQTLTLTDGYTTNELSDNSLLAYPDSFRAIVSGASGSLIFSGYDKNNCLVSADIRTVDGTITPEVELFDTTTSDDIVKVKVFLWDLETLDRKASSRYVYTDESMVDGAVTLLFNNSNYAFAEADDAPYRLSGKVYLPTDLVSALTGENDLTFTAGSTEAQIDGESVKLSTAPVQYGEDVLVALEDVTANFSIGQDVTERSGGIALHTEYYDEETTFFNLNTTFTGDPKTERGFSWEAVSEYDNMVIQYAEGTSLANPTQKKAPYKTEPVVYGYHVTNPQAEISYYDNMLFYQVEVDGLKAGTTYSYRIGDTEKDEWSQVYTFSTEGENTEEFSVIALADSQANTVTNFGITQRAVQAALNECSDPAFVMHLGDFTENAMCDDWWNMYFEASESFNPTIPTVGVVGNHETRAVGQKYFNLHFLNPDNGHGLAPENPDSTMVNQYDMATLKELDNTVYSFDYGDVHFAVLNTGSDWMKTSYVMDLQQEWLKEDIAKSNKKWNIVLLHIGVYPAQDRGQVTAAHLYELMDECDVDMVFQGHDHITLRTKPMKGNVPYTEGSATQVSHSNGTIYSILGCAGVGTTRYNYSVLPSGDWIETVKTTGSSNPTYNILTFKEDSITMLSKALDGTVLDSYTLTK